jgi:hypothetical protein
VTTANRNDISEMAPLVNKLPEVAGEVGHPRRKPDALQGDLAYDSEPHRQGLRLMGIEPVLPEKGIDDDSGLGETRWPVERTLAWLHQNRRLRIRYERRPDIHQGPGATTSGTVNCHNILNTPVKARQLSSLLPRAQASPRFEIPPGGYDPNRSA